MSMAVGAAVPSVSVANMAGSLLVLVFTLFGGFFLSRHHVPWPITWLVQLSYVRYAFEALLINEFHGAAGFRFTGFAPKGTAPDHIPHVDVTGDQILATFGFDLDTLRPDLCWLCGLCALFLTATFFLLKYRGRPY